VVSDSTQKSKISDGTVRFFGNIIYKLKGGIARGTVRFFGSYEPAVSKRQIRKVI